MIILPTIDTADFSVRVNLDQVIYDMRCRWNNLSNSWFMYLGPSTKTPILKTRLVTNRNLLESTYFREDMPKGALFLLDSQKIFGRASRDDFGQDKRFKIVYFSEGEF